MKPVLLFEGEGWRIVRILLPVNNREPKKPGEPEDDGYRDLIEVTDGSDLLGTQRWTRLEKKAEGVATYDRIVHAMKRELLRLLPDVQEQENTDAENLRNAGEQVSETDRRGPRVVGDSDRVQALQRSAGRG